MSSVHGNELVTISLRSGCNPKVKNLDGLLPKKIADQCKAKDAKKNMRKAEKGYNDMTLNLRPGRSMWPSFATGGRVCVV